MVTADGSFVVTLNSDGSFANELIKFDKHGNVVWQKKYNFHGSSDIIFEIIPTSDNGIACITTLEGGDFTITKLDAIGNIVWAKSYAYIDGYSNATAITEYNNSLCVIGFGYKYSGPLTYNMLARFDINTGAIIWAKHFSSSAANPSFFRFHSIGVHNDKLVVSGEFSATSYGIIKQGLFNFSGAGVLERAVQIQNQNNNIFSSFGYYYPVFNETGNIGAHSFRDDTSDVFLFKLNAANQIEWQWRYVMPGAQGVCSIKNTSDGGVAGAGSFGSYGTDAVIYLFKADTVGKTGGCNLQDPGLTATAVTIDTSSRVLSINNGWVDLESPPYFTITNANFTTQKLCSANTACAVIRIAGSDSVCKKNIAYQYTLTKDTGCHKIVSWKLSDPSFAQIINQTDSTIKLQYLRSGTVKLYASLLPACSLTADSLTVTILNNPDSLNLGSDINLCINGFYELNARTGYKKYLWQDGSVDSVFTVTAPGSYHVTVTDYCDNTSTDTINVFAAPAEFVDIGNDTIICRKDSVTLSVAPGFTAYTWSPAYNITNISQYTTRVYPYTDTLYKLKVTTRPGCTLMDSIRISLFPTPVIRLGNDTGLCFGKTIMLDAGTGFQNYLWNTGETTQQITVSQKNRYAVRATDISGCVSADTVEVINVYPNPVITIAKDTSICEYKTLTINAGPGYDHYLWSTGETANKIVIKNAGLFWLMVTDKNGCTAKENISVISKNCLNLIYFPNSFTPNNDGFNDFFKPGVYGTLEKYELTIYNRYGHLVFHTSNPFNGWDGNVNSKPQNAGTYTWFARYKFSGILNEIQTGTILLMR